MAFGVVLLSGCRSIPTLVPDMRWGPRQPVALTGPHGTLGPEQSKGVLARLKTAAPATDIFDRHLAVEAAIAGSPLVVGNQVEILVDGPATYKAMDQAIAGARASINIETYTFENDEIGKRFLASLVVKQRQGVQVNIIFDSFGSLNTPKTFFTAITALGGNVVEFNPVNLLNLLNPAKLPKGTVLSQRDHRKLMVVDGELAFVGGINISSVYSGGSHGEAPGGKTRQRWRDTHLRMAGPIAAEFQKLFLETWVRQKGKALPGNGQAALPGSRGKEVVRAMGSTPEEPYCQIYSTLLSAINSAETEVLLTNAYFVPDPQLVAVLKAAVKRGVDVRLLLPGKTDSVLVFHASHSYFTDLLAAGVRIYERQDAFLHAKTAVIDGVWSTIGSTNLDWRSFVHNQELNAVILGADFGGRMQAMYRKDLEASREINLKQWRRRPVLSRIKERAARLWARFL